MADPSETTQVSESPADVDTAELVDAVRSLAAQVGSLQADLQALRVARDPLPAPEADVHGWDERPLETVGARRAAQWIRSLDAPGTRRPAVPRLPLEIAFLVAVAGVAALARLDALVVVAVMAVAWALVAAAEWAAADEAARREEALASSGFALAAAREDASWFAPQADDHVPIPADEREETSARLPPAPEE